MNDVIDHCHQMFGDSHDDASGWQLVSSQPQFASLPDCFGPAPAYLAEIEASDVLLYAVIAKWPSTQMT